MKLNYKYEGLRVAILGLFSVAMLIYMSVVANAGHADNKSGISKQDNMYLRAYYYLKGSEAPTFRGSPVVPVFYDATGEHDKLLNKVETFALYYAGVSKAITINDLGVNEEPTFAFVIADHKIEDSQLAEPLKSILTEKWKDTPVSTALNADVMGYRVNGVLDGTDCSMFFTLRIGENPSNNLANSIAIIANSSMPEADIFLCFKNKIALAFGLGTPRFDNERNMASRPRDHLYFGHYPALLNIYNTCRISNARHMLSCVGDSARSSFGGIIDFLSDE